jgi:hypothetical protein
MPPKKPTDNHPISRLRVDPPEDIVAGLLNRLQWKQDDPGTFRVYFVVPNPGNKLSSLNLPMEYSHLDVTCLHERSHPVRFMNDGIGEVETFVNANHLYLTGVLRATSLGLILTFQADDLAPEWALMVLRSQLHFEPWKKMKVPPGSLTIQLQPPVVHATGPTLHPAEITSVYEVEGMRGWRITYADGQTQQIAEDAIENLPQSDIARVYKWLEGQHAAKNFFVHLRDSQPGDPITPHPF